VTGGRYNQLNYHPACKVCHLKGIDKCEVEVGKVSLTAKSGQTIDREEISKAITSADKNFKVVTPKKQ
jgi:hypothetical protein